MREIVLVTGSSGRLGAAVAAQLTPQYHVVGFDRRLPADPSTGPETTRLDLRSDRSVQAGLGEVRRRHGEQLAAVIHLAEYEDAAGAPSPRYQEINVSGTERLLRGLQGFRVGQFVLRTTILVHAPCRPGQHLREDSRLGPRGEYPRSKLRAEEVVRALHGETPYVLVRLASLYDDDCHNPALARQIQRILERRLSSHVFPGNAHHARPSLHRDDAAALLEQLVALRGKLPAALALLAGEPAPVSYHELQTALARLLHHEEWQTHEIPRGLARMGAWLQQHLPFVDEPPFGARLIDQADDHYALDIGQAYRLLGWEPRHALLDELPKLVARLQADPRAWYREHGLKAPVGLKGSRIPEKAHAV
jgi:nucleoside-diphosphate-sugar epimerase